MSVTLASRAGYCFGVRRAVELALEVAGKAGSPVYTAGPLIHNRFVIEELARRGVTTAESLDRIPPQSRVIVRAHGLPVQQWEEISEKNCEIFDATCPFVAKIHDIVARESGEGRRVIILGKADHPEVKAIASRCKNPVIVENSENLDAVLANLRHEQLSVVCQTTFRTEICGQIVNKLKNTCKSIRIFDTICRATELRQSEARRLAAESDAVAVIGDRSSSNSRNLYELCLSLCPNTQFVEQADELSLSAFENATNIFVTAGASTPDSIIKEVYKKMTDEIKNANTESFEELLEQSLKTLHTGEKVTGVITQINPTEIHVDLGVKQAGYIPVSELSDDPTYVVADNIKVGDEIEAYVMRVNDIEGLIMLSKKRLDAVKNWEKLEQAVESKEAMDGIVIDQNKGGVVALVMGIRVFVPASQTGLPREASFDSLLKTRQKIRITEVNRQRRRVVGSIKALLAEQRKEAAAKIWETIEVGKKYEGVVKSFTSYGAFIDIGGVDGMVHISELSWSRVKHPSDVLQIGQKVNVYVIALDHEKKKISLGYRLSGDNPWNKFEESYKVGDVVDVKVVKFMPFGAFAEVLPGVDGLIHISQIADRRIGKPEEVLQIGQQVEAKIIDIDHERQKISLSIRALLDPSAAPLTEEETQDAE